jgi:hypothetical protein
LFVAPFQGVGAWALDVPARPGDRGSVHLLESVLQHGAVGFGQETLIDLDNPVWADAEEILIVGGVMNLAETQAVAYDGETRFMCVWPDVGGVEEFAVLQPADGALSLVGTG